MNSSISTSVIFPGQGSQFPGMGKYLFDNFQKAKPIFEEASDALHLDLKKLCFDGSEKDLALTENTQPALLTVSTVTWNCLKEESGLKPLAFAGHSVGEYAALVAAGSLKFSDALRAVRLRGQEMQKAVPVGIGGMMAVLGMDAASVQALCQKTIQEMALQLNKDVVLSPANFNAPGQVVISGHQSAIAFLKENLKTEIYDENLRKAKLIPLNVSAPFHCSLMKPAEKAMADHFQKIPFSDASPVQVVQNTTATAVSSAYELKKNLTEQVSACVLWATSIEKMVKMGSTRFVECGSGKVLAGLGKKISAESVFLTTSTLEDFQNLLQNLKASSHWPFQNSC